ncbi:MAG: hypothetical protein PHE20_02965 [Patescibacteria group bacterium]|nr:hypothetical protein [Patescibacteria group bacterium]
MFSYRIFLKQAWSITKKYRHLWFFGIFASLTAIGGEYQLISQGFTAKPGGHFLDNGIFTLYNFFNPTFYSSLGQLSATNPAAFWSLISVVVLAILLVLVMVYLAITSQVALVEQSARLILSKKKSEKLSINEGISFGRRHIWPVLGLNIANSFIISLCLFITSLPLAFLLITDSSALSLTYSVLFIIFVPVALAIALIMKYAIAAQVLENFSFIASIEKAWKIFHKNWLVSLEMALMLFLINFIVGLFTLIVVSLFFVPLLLLSLQLYAPFLMALSLILIIASMIIVASILNTFQISAWTSLYLHLQQKRGISKLERLFKNNQ